jgi:hypothetical protein
MSNKSDADVPAEDPPSFADVADNKTPPSSPDDATLRPLWDRNKPASKSMVLLSWLIRRAALAAIALELLGHLPLKGLVDLPYGILLEDVKPSSWIKSLARILPDKVAIIGNVCARYADLGWMFTLVKTLLRPFWHVFADLGSSVVLLITTVCGSFLKGFFDALPVGPQALLVIGTFLAGFLIILILLEAIGALKKIDVIRFSFWLNLGSSESFTIVRWFTTVCCFITKLVLEMDAIRKMIVRAFPFLGLLFRNFGQAMRYIGHSIWTFFVRTPRQAIVDSFSSWFEPKIKRISDLWNEQLDFRTALAVAVLICLMISFAWAIVWFVLS